MDSSPLARILGTKSKTIMAEAEKRCKLSLSVFRVSILSLIHWILRPYILYITFNDKTTIINVWMPWSLETITGWAVVYVIQTIHVTTAIFGLLSFDSIFNCMSEMLLAQFSILHLALSKINFRKTNSLKYSKEAKRKNFSLKYSKEAKRKDLKDLNMELCIDFHKKLLSMVNTLKEFTDNVQIAQVVILTIVFCLSIFEASSLKGVTINKVLNLMEMLLCFISSNFMYCYYSTMIAYQCEEVGRSAYMNNWYEASIKERKSIIMMVERCKKKQIFGKFINVDLNTFIAMMKTAFSYYNVLRAFEIN